MFLGLKHNKIKFQTPAGLKKTNFQKLKSKKNLGFQRIEPMTVSDCFRAKTATVALISHFKILTFEEL
jgi:hypothetical protein